MEHREAGATSSEKPTPERDGGGRRVTLSGGVKTQVSRIVAEQIGPVVKQAVTEAFATSSREDPERRLRCHEAAPLLGLTEASLRKRVQRGDVKCERIGRALRFKYADLVALRSASASK